MSLTSALPGTLQLGYSFCPNDTFIFHALHAGLVPAPLPVSEVLEDVQTLNDWAALGRLPMTKISYRAIDRDARRRQGLEWQNRGLTRRADHR